MNTTNAQASDKASYAVELRQAELAYGGRVVLSGIDLAIAHNQFVAVLGSNGAGKTTLMRSILGLIAPRRGSVLVLGQRAGKGNRTIGYVPQMRSFLGSARLTGMDFVASALHAGRWGWHHVDAQSARAIGAVLERVQAQGLARRPVMEMSGGERQRLLLAQALLGEPALLLLDEPLISLDLQHQGNIIRLVRDLQQDLGITVLFSAHEINPLLGAVDQVLYLGSQHAALGTVDQVITAPVLSGLYGTPIDVLRHQGRIFVMAGQTEVEKADHCHDV